MTKIKFAQEAKKLKKRKNLYVLTKKVSGENIILKQLKPICEQINIEGQTGGDLKLLLNKFRQKKVNIPKGFIQTTFDIEGKRKTWEGNPIRVAEFICSKRKIKSYSQLKKYLPTIISWIKKGFADMKSSNLRIKNGKLINIDEMHSYPGIGANPYQFFFLKFSRALKLSPSQKNEFRNKIISEINQQEIKLANFSDSTIKRYLSELDELSKKNDIPKEILELARERVNFGYHPVFALRSELLRNNKQELAEQIFSKEMLAKVISFYNKGMNWTDAYKKATKNYE